MTLSRWKTVLLTKVSVVNQETQSAIAPALHCQTFLTESSFSVSLVRIWWMRINQLLFYDKSGFTLTHNTDRRSKTEQYTSVSADKRECTMHDVTTQNTKIVKTMTMTKNDQNDTQQKTQSSRRWCRFRINSFILWNDDEMHNPLSTWHTKLRKS